MSDAAQFRVRIQMRLDRFDLDVEYTARCRVTGLFGASGSGKTSWLESMAGLRRGARGRIESRGVLWQDSAQGVFLPPERRLVGYVPQEHLLFPHLSVRGNLLFARERAGADFDRLFADVVDVLEIGPLLPRGVGELSGGERQRVALGRALCSGARMLLLDEPLAALDHKLRHRILPFLRRVRDHFDLPILIVSHNPIELQALCDEVVALKDGRIVAAGRPAEVFTRPDVYGIAQGEGFRNVIPCVVAGATAGSSIVRVGATGDGPTLFVPRLDAPDGSPAMVDVAASEIIVAVGRPVGLSARNAVPARVVAVSGEGPMKLLTASVCPESEPLAVEITQESLSELAIGPGSEVFLVIKSSSFSVYSA
ncbi:MAG TPA: molybdenum ABC transporter ATP-binding protein [Opitutales bacterium]|nr:molybdenum ABC transporter ATP-binding protein [Opitutales bacterium]